ncbi:hypothetical protein [Nodularia chucula]|uniref:hypothetical protein n=1 Tax=Nodularia chucula TaxID=3093667 RepID=UPI0039C6C14E
MKNKLNQGSSSLFYVACKGLKYFLLTLLGFAIAFVMSRVFGVSQVVQMLLYPSIWAWIFRIAVSIFCLFAVAIIYESSR